MMRQGWTGYGRSACLLLATGVLLAGCGSDAPNRMGGGTAGGAATGASFGLIGGPIGVLIGGAVGGGIGALTAANTTPKQIDLGNPPWASGGNPATAPNGSTPSNQNGLRSQIKQYQTRQSQAGSASSSGYPAQSGYGQPQPLMPAAGQGQTGYGQQGVQAQPLAPPAASPSS
ncbi:hypothetical protein [Acidiphilium iwatense]|uniref:Glycine zipper domain-containing protein n=1 Tax=Acidiphilium iwatense TaxID=768198 RepID=A0ABS9E387_9PROT|nr:hypothetical protein [Acidiphilium iwatense]MCF3948505.1 hypothetical protein [Acidiphilium iwatense]